MEKLNKFWRILLGLALTAMAVQQLVYSDFIPVILPTSFPAWLPVRPLLVWIFSLIIIIGCLGIIFEIKARIASIFIGCILLLFVVFFHIPFHLGEESLSLGVWTDTMKALALSGGAFIIAGSFPSEKNNSTLSKGLQRLLPLGKYFVTIMVIGFGLDHFLYTGFIAKFVPKWMPGHLFWTYFTGLCLIAGGVAITLNLYRRVATTLLGIMFLSWLILLHIPRAIVDPFSNHGNEWTSVFEIIAFAGSAFLIDRPAAVLLYNKKRNNKSKLTLYAN